MRDSVKEQPFWRRGLAGAMAAVLAFGLCPAPLVGGMSAYADDGDLAPAQVELSGQEVAFDNSTNLADGEYPAEQFEFTWTGGTGKAFLTLDKVIVADGKITGEFTASSANMTHAYYLGHTSSDADDPSIYDPVSGKKTDGCVDITNKKVAFPVVLNKSQDIACRTTAMSEPHWVQYNYTITLKTTQNLVVTNDVRMFSPAAQSTLVREGDPATDTYSEKLVLEMTSTSMKRAFVGELLDAYETDDGDKQGIVDFVSGVDGDTKGTFTLDVTAVENNVPFAISFYSSDWYGRTATLDRTNGTLHFTPYTPTGNDNVDLLIRKIQVQERTETTDADCAAAKAAWDALSDKEKLKVRQWDYFGRDTGDASEDDPLNADKIGKNEILVVSFGTSFNDSRVATIGGIEKAVQKAYPQWSVRRAFTAQIIINHIQARDGEKIDNMQQALDRAVANGVENLMIVPTHLMHGAEYDELVDALRVYQTQMNITVSEPLLGEVGASDDVINADKEAVAQAVVEAANVPSDTALVLMGHGTSHNAKITYKQMQSVMSKLNYNHVFVGTVEGEPEGTDAASIIAKVKNAGFKKVILRPLMVVAGDHANNDMADPEDSESWISQFTAEGNFAAENVTCQISGLGEIAAIQQIYVSHLGDAFTKVAAANEVATAIAALPKPDEITPENAAEKKSAVESARTQYDALTDGQKVLVDEAPLLEAELKLATIAADVAAEAAADVSATPEQKLAAAEAKAAAAELATKVATAAKEKAEQSEAWAKKVQADAEADAKAANAVKKQAEKDAAAAEAAKNEAESKAIEAENAKKAAETAKSTAESQAAAAKTEAANAKKEAAAQKTAADNAKKEAAAQKTAADNAKKEAAAQKTAADNAKKAQKAAESKAKAASGVKANTMKVKAKTVKAKAKKKTTVKKAKAFTVKNAKGKVTFFKTSGNAKITISKSGKVTVKKGLKKGKTYKVKVLVCAKGNKQYAPAFKNVTLKVKVTK